MHPPGVPRATADVCAGRVCVSNRVVSSGPRPPEASRQSLLTEAAQDPPTGVLNRRGVLAALETDLATHAREQAPLSLFMVDLDRFKAINDQFGHSAGDRALVWVVARLREMLRDGDRLGRYGGDEFLAVLPHTALEQAQDIARRIEANLNEAAALESARPGASIGIGAAPQHGWDAASPIDAADRMLYARKGRRRTDPDAGRRPTSTHRLTSHCRGWRSPCAPLPPRAHLVGVRRFTATGEFRFSGSAYNRSKSSVAILARSSSSDRLGAARMRSNRPISRSPQSSAR